MSLYFIATRNAVDAERTEVDMYRRFRSFYPIAYDRQRRQPQYRREELQIWQTLHIDASHFAFALGFRGFVG